MWGNKSHRAMRPRTRSTRFPRAIAARAFLLHKGTMPVAVWGPCVAVCGGGIARRVADRMSVIVSSVHGCTVETARRRTRTFSTGCAESALPGCPFFWCTFLWTSKEKSPVRFADGTLLISGPCFDLCHPGGQDAVVGLRSPLIRCPAPPFPCGRRVGHSAITPACRQPSTTPPATSAAQHQPAATAHPSRRRQPLHPAQDHSQSSTRAASLQDHCRSTSHP